MEIGRRLVDSDLCSCKKNAYQVPHLYNHPVKCDFPSLTLQWQLLCQSTTYQQQSHPMCGIAEGQKCNLLKNQMVYQQHNSCTY